MSPPNTQSRLFQPLQVGATPLAHRLVFPPLTRFRNTEQAHVPLVPMVPDYYAQRAAVPGTLLIAEATAVSLQGAGSPHSPGIWSTEQIDAWRNVTDAVHAKGSYIYCQLWHVGRAAIAENIQGKGLDVVGPSALKMPVGHVVRSDAATPRALPEHEILACIQDFAQAARNSIAAGFDGVELHGANGYLIDEFTQSNTNVRDDQWGGSVENRSRFGLAVTKAIVDAIGADRVGYRISPYSDFQGMLMPDPKPQFTHLVSGLRDLDLAYMHVVMPRICGDSDAGGAGDLDWVFKAWNPSPQEKRPVILAGGFTPESALEYVDGTAPDGNVLIAIGRRWIPNPDLVWRVLEGAPLEQYDRATFYDAKASRGYNDYAFHPQFDSGVLLQAQKS